jgi:GNAT superfamily N-acetyltransferase
MLSESPAGTAALSIARFEKALHDRSAFSCGFTPIDNFLKSSLSDQIKGGLVTAWVATSEDDPAVLGFYTLSAMAVRAIDGPTKWQRSGVPDIPVIYIRAVAVRKDIQGKGLGTALLLDAMKRSLVITEQLGAAAITLDVLEDQHFEQRWKFYIDLGFRPLGDPDNPRRVFIPMADVRATLS